MNYKNVYHVICYVIKYNKTFSYIKIFSFLKKKGLFEYCQERRTRFKYLLYSIKSSIKYEMEHDNDNNPTTNEKL